MIPPSSSGSSLYALRASPTAVFVPLLVEIVARDASIDDGQSLGSRIVVGCDGGGSLAFIPCFLLIYHRS